jgi:hypothetical protein
VYSVVFGAEGQSRLPPTETDLELPKHYIASLGRIVEQAQLEQGDPQARLQQLHAYLQSNYRYSLDLSIGNRDIASVLDFLLNTKKGHCEYFAAATVLLARQMGIPARYHTGYSVQEYSDLEGMFVVRAQHAHAWASVWLNGVWQDFDTTPPDWSALDRDANPPSAIRDFFAWLWFSWQAWRDSPGDYGFMAYSVWLLPPLAVWLAYYLVRRRRNGKRGGVCEAIHELELLQCTDLYPLLLKLNRKERWRRPHETMAAWIHREFPQHAEEVGRVMERFYMQRYGGGYAVFACPKCVGSFKNEENVEGAESVHSLKSTQKSQSVESVESAECVPRNENRVQDNSRRSDQQKALEVLMSAV